MAAVDTLELFRARLSEFVATNSVLHSTMTFESRGVWVYLRRAWEWVDGELYLCLDIANVRVKSQRRGTFTMLLKIAQDVCPWHAVRVESVGNPHLAAYLRRLATTDERWTEEAHSFSPDFVWLKDRDGEYTTPGDGERQTRASERKMRDEAPTLAMLMAAIRASQDSIPGRN